MGKGISGRGSSARAVLPTGGRSCQLKAQYTAKTSAWAGFGAYMQKRGGQLEEEQGAAFGQAAGNEFEPELNAKRVLRKWAAEALPKENLFKFVLSPEHLPDHVSLQEFTLRFMQVMSKDLGTELDWVAINHHDTSLPHVHLAIRGRTENGEHLVISPRYLKETARARASEALYSLAGALTPDEAKRTVERETVSLSWTSLDAKLRETQAKNGLIDLSKPPRVRDGLEAVDEHLRLRRRVKHLRKAGLASEVAPGKWALSSHAELAMAQLQLARDKSKKAHAKQVFLTDTKAPLFASELSFEGQWAAGRIVAKQDQPGAQAFVLLEGLDGKAHFLTSSELPALPKAGATVWLEHDGKGLRAESFSLEDKELVRKFVDKTNEAVPSVESRYRSYADKFAEKAWAEVQARRKERGQPSLEAYAEMKKRAFEEERERALAEQRKADWAKSAKAIRDGGR